MDYGDIAAQYPAEPQPERVRFDFQAACNEQDRCITNGQGQCLIEPGQCVVNERRLDQAEAVITKLNDAVEHRVDAYNLRGQALTECSVSKAERDITIQHQEDLLFRQQIVSAGKQLVIGGVCGLLLW